MNSSIKIPIDFPMIVLNLTNLTSSNLTKINANSAGVQIASFARFFKISAFFIAFVLFYFLTVPLFMHFVGKSWKVLGGLVAVLREKGYSTKMVTVFSLSILYIFIG
jgi:hypothetical protein